MLLREIKDPLSVLANYSPPPPSLSSDSFGVLFSSSFKPLSWLKSRP